MCQTLPVAKGELAGLVNAVFRKNRNSHVVLVLK